MAIPWSRMADMTQRSVSLALSFLTLVGVGVLIRGGYKVVQRKKALQLAAENDNTQISQQVRNTV